MRAVVFYVVIGIAAFVSAPTLAFSTESEATDILNAMSDYISSQEIIELTFDSDIEIITPRLEKIQFTSSGDAALKRPDKIRAHRRSGHVDVAMYFDGKIVKIHGRDVNGYAEFEAPGTIDDLIHSIREGRGVALPGADLLLANSFDLLTADIIEAKRIGYGIVSGVQCEHLAFRNFDTDWQIWVEVGDTPIPRKMVVTSKTMNSAPQYTLRINSWKTGVELPQSEFEFTPSDDAIRLNHNALIELDELPPGKKEGEGK